MPISATLVPVNDPRAYRQPLFHDRRGTVLLVSDAVWLGIGAFWMSRLVEV